MPGNVETGAILLRVLPVRRGQQFGVRSDVRARLIRGLTAPLNLGLRPGISLHTSTLTPLEPIFIIRGAAKRHDRLICNLQFPAHANCVTPGRASGGTSTGVCQSVISGMSTSCDSIAFVHVSCVPV
jgi:hypothetical protein